MLLYYKAQKRSPHLKPQRNSSLQLVAAQELGKIMQPQVLQYFVFYAQKQIMLCS